MARPRSIRTIASVAAAALALGLFGCSTTTTPASGQSTEVTQLVLAHVSGVNGAAIKAIAKDFSEETGIKVTTLEISDTDYGPKIKLAQQTGRADFDAALGIPTDIFLLTDKPGMYAPLDTAKFDPDGLAGLQEGKLIGTNYLVSADLTAFVVTPASGAAPQTWTDFYDTSAYPGYRGLQSGGFGVIINVITALLADGVAPADLYPLDLDRAFRKLDTVKGSLTLWDTAPKAIQDVVDGNLALSVAYSPAALGAVKDGKPVAANLLPDTPVVRSRGAVMEKGPNGPAAGNAFMAYWSKPSVQVKYTQLTNDGIILPSPAVYKLLPPETLKRGAFVPGQPQGTLINYEYLIETGPNGVSNLDEIVNRWNQWRASS